ncbi:MAG: phosphoribosylamine--glycine ligase [Chloracidobacterium sp.]|nr:phosphoribosylamine--glycine ligase [Chloracidobacterium sp.]
MNVLVIGSGGREHAICRTFSKSSRVTRLFCANGNAGIAQVAECVPVRPDDIFALADFATLNAIDLTFVGGETSLALGVVDEFEARGLKIIGPCKEAARLEASKSFAKDFMARHGVPTAKFTTSHSPAFAILELESGDFGDENSPVVVKADGLAAGKGVVVAKNRTEAVGAIKEMADLVGTAAAEKIVLEECMFGREVSLLMFADGEDFALMPPTRDHKRIGEGDTGPNTGGMGTFTDSSLLTTDELQIIKDTMIRPTLHGCIREGFRFRGIMFLGIMMTAQGPKLLEYNVRFGDPETQAILVRLETDLFDICAAMLDGTLSSIDIKWKPGSSACVVLASEAYPQKPRTGDVINGLENVSGVEVFHAGTSKDEAGNYITSGGRVLGVTATGDDLSAALSTAYSAVAKISFEGMQFRRDIGK